MAKNKHLIGLLALVVLAVLAVHGDALGIPQVLAQGAGQQVRGQLGEPAVNIMSVLGIVISFLTVIAYIALWILQYLLSTEFLTDPVILAHLNQIWILSRDLMNLGFALMLIGVAIYTIITAKKEMIQTKLVQFVTAVILVNFSWFFPRVIIDIANILTSTIYSIPNMLPGFACVMHDDNATPPLQPCKVILDVKILPEAAEAQAFCPNPNDPNCKCLTGLVCYRTGDFITAANLAPGHAMINGLAVSFARLQALAQVPGSPVDPAGASQNIITISLRMLVTTVLSAVLIMAVTLPLIALAIGLVIRMVILWVCVAFMPFAFIGYVINGKLGVPGLPSEYDIWNNFKSAAFLPTVVAIPIAIGFVMLSSTAQIAAPNNGLVINVPLVNGVRTWWHLMWQCAAIGIIYTGAFTALKSNQLIGNFTEKVKGFGDSIAGAAATAPMLIPLPLPGPGGERRTLGQLVNTPRQLQQAIQSSALTGKSLKETFGGIRTGATSESGINIDQAAKTLNQDNANTTRVVEAIQRLNNPALTGAAREEKLAELRQALIANGVGDPTRLNSNNVLPELRRIAERQGSAGRIGAQLNNIDAAIAQGRPATPPTPPAPPRP